MRFVISRRKLFVTIQVVILALLGSFVLKSAGLLVPLDNYCLRFFYCVREWPGFRGRPAYPHKDVVVVGVDDAFFSQLGRSSLTCKDYLDLLRAVRKGGAKAVGLDVLLSEGDGGQDKELAAELDNVVLPYVLVRSGGKAPNSPNRYEPTPVLKGAAAGLGYWNPRYKRAGCRMQLVYEATDEIKISFPLAVLAVYAGKKPRDVEVDDFRVRVGKFELPVEEDHTFWVNYFPVDYLGTRESEHQISAVQVLAGTARPDVFKDKLVLIGRTDRDAPRYVPTPVDKSGRMGKFSEVQIFANVLSTMLDGFVEGQFIGPQRRLISALLLTALIMVTCLFVLVLRPIYSIAVFAVEVLASIYGGCLLFTWWNCVADLPLLLSGVTQAFGLMMIYVAYRREDEVTALSAYIAPAVRRRIVDSSRRIPLEGERKELTILFADLRGFTAMSHRMDDPRATVVLLNEYFDAIVPIIGAEGREGTVDKLMGDGLLAFFGEPIPFRDSPQRAASTALAMQAAFRQMYAQWATAGRLPPAEKQDKPLGLGIAIATGPVIVGNIGCTSRRLMNYTVIGDAVNMASGLQRMAERGQILIDQRTADLLAADGFPTRRIGPCNLKGVTVEAYELLGPGPERKLSQGAEADK